MHLFFFVRGIKQQINLFEMFMQTQMWAWKRKNLKTGKYEYVQVQGALRVTPFGYEYIFPEEHLNEVLTMLGAQSDRWIRGKFKHFFMRLMLGSGDNGEWYKPIPKFTPVATNRYIEMKGLALYFIGIKKDSRQVCKEWGYEQEML